MNKKERRKHPRIQKSTEIKFRVSGNGSKEDIEFKVGRTRDISLSGVYCTVSKFIPLFTILEGFLTLPIEGKDPIVHFRGVVVRSEPEKETEGVSEYNIAIFFQETADEEDSDILEL